MYKLHPYQRKLVNQARQSLAKGNHSVLVVSPAGSGKSIVIAEIARLTQQKGGHVMFTVHRKELTEQINQSFKNNNVDLSKCTIMTVGKIANRLGKLQKPSLIITDETHHSLAKTYKKIYDYYSDVPLIGFTATPWRMNHKGLGHVYDDMVEGPDVSWLIKNHYLAPYKYYSVKLIDDTKLKKSSTGDHTNKSISQATESSTIYGDVIQTYLDKTPGQQAIVYCHSIEFSKLVAKKFREAGVNAAHVDSKTPQVQREQIMSDFKRGKIKALCNIDLISEGFNVPDCSVVIMLRPTASLVVDVQQSMRSMRYRPHKKATIIDHVANYQRFGLPDTPRDWTLKDRAKTKKNNVSDPPIRQCPQCFGIISAKDKVCPLCGFVFKAEQSEMKIDKTARLKQINNNDFDLKANYIVTKNPKDLNTMDELQEFAKAKGYKPGWAYYQAKAKNII